MFKVDIKDTLKILKTLNKCQWRRSGVFIIKFEHISHLVQVFLFLTLNM